MIAAAPQADHGPDRVRVASAADPRIGPAISPAINQNTTVAADDGSPRIVFRATYPASRTHSASDPQAAARSGDGARRASRKAIKLHEPAQFATDRNAAGRYCCPRAVRPPRTRAIATIGSSNPTPRERRGAGWFGTTGEPKDPRMLLSAGRSNHQNDLHRKPLVRANFTSHPGDLVAATFGRSTVCRRRCVCRPPDSAFVPGIGMGEALASLFGSRQAWSSFTLSKSTTSIDF